MVTYSTPTKEELQLMTTKDKLCQIQLDFMWYRGVIIQAVIDLEMALDLIITKYFNPKMRNDFNTFLLNTEAVSLGSKINVFECILNNNSYDDFLNKNTKEKLTNDKFITELRQANSTRNDLAHCKLAGEDEIAEKYDGDKIFFRSSKKGLTKLKSIKMTNLNNELKELIDLHNKVAKFHQKYFKHQ